MIKDVAASGNKPGAAFSDKIGTLRRIYKKISLSRRKFHALLKEDGLDFLVRYYGNRRLIIREAFARYLAMHPELRKR